MTISAPDLTIPAAVSATICDDAVLVELADGRTISAPLAWYPRLVHATEVERQNVRLIGGGTGLHWRDIEEDISVESIIRGRPSAESAASLKRWLAARSKKT